jgi:hypothetical protein
LKRFTSVEARIDAGAAAIPRNERPDRLSGRAETE